jgi:hypothetical protein
MDDAPVLAAFPRRPLRLVRTRDHVRKRLLGLGFVVLLAVPAAWFFYDVWRESGLRADLRERGVVAELLHSEGTCTSRRQISGDEPLGCNLTITYAVRKEHGGSTRSADVWLDGARPRVFTPPPIYDPQAPDRVMLRSEIERDMRWGEVIGPSILAVFPLLALLWWLATGSGALARAARNPDPVIVPVERFARRGTSLQVWFRAPDGGAPVRSEFPEGSGPLFVEPSGGSSFDRPHVLGLARPGKIPVLLDRDLARLDFTDEERRAVWRAAGDSSGG